MVVLAQDEARELKHDYIGTEHLLLGLLREQEGIAARVLTSLNVSIDDVRARVRETAGEGDAVSTGQIPFLPGAKKSLEVALHEARALGHYYIGTEHLLLGLARVDEGLAAEILAARGIGADALRNAVIHALGAPGVVRYEQKPFRPRPRFRLTHPVGLIATGWTLCALGIGIGIAIGWAIWH